MSGRAGAGDTTSLALGWLLLGAKRDPKADGTDFEDEETDR
jgi:hypothetical protein